MAEKVTVTQQQTAEGKKAGGIDKGENGCFQGRFEVRGKGSRAAPDGGSCRGAGSQVSRSGRPFLGEQRGPGSLLEQVPGELYKPQGF